MSCPRRRRLGGVAPATAAALVLVAVFSLVALSPAKADAGHPSEVFDKWSTECKTLGGTGSLTSECVVSQSHSWGLSDIVTVVGPGNITVKENVTLSIDQDDGSSTRGGFNITIGGSFKLEAGATLRAPTIVLASDSLDVQTRAAVNASGLGNAQQGSPFGNEFGAGYGGTGAACKVDADMSRGRSYGWGYSFNGVSFPFAQEGGGSSSLGTGGGRVYVETKGNVTLAGTIESNGLGSYANPGGGGSGGSTTIRSAGIINNSTDYSAAIAPRGAGDGAGRAELAARGRRRRREDLGDVPAVRLERQARGLRWAQLGELHDRRVDQQRWGRDDLPVRGRHGSAPYLEQRPRCGEGDHQ